MMLSNKAANVLNDIFDAISGVVIRMWNDNGHFSLGIALLVGIVFLIVSEILCFAVHHVQKESMIEYIYGTMYLYERKEFDKRYRCVGIVDRLLLVTLFKQSEKKRLFLIICFFNNILACCASVAALIGSIGCIITRGLGWCMVLLVFSGIGTVFITTIISFYPSVICLQSEKDRYMGRNRSKK